MESRAIGGPEGPSRLDTSPRYDSRVLRRRLTRFLSSHAKGRLALTKLLAEFAGPRWDALVFGGLPRDLMVFGARAAPRDVDVVVQHGGAEDIERNFGPLIRRRTRFGGYVLGINGWRVDVWPLKQTWAIRSGIIHEADPRSLTRSTFLNVEAVAVSLRTHGARGRAVFENGFLEAVRTKSLDINLEANPYPALCVARSLILAATLDFSLSDRLVRYINERARSLDIEDLLRAQVSHYGFVRRYGEHLRAWLSLVRKHVHQGGSPGLRLPCVPYKQLDLLGSTNVEMMVAPEPTHTVANADDL